jgi:hypothetical protein
LAHSPTVKAALQTAKSIFGRILAAKPDEKIITLYDEEAKVCGTICKKSKATDPYRKKMNGWLDKTDVANTNQSD